jgi:hypothetical protein
MDKKHLSIPSIIAMGMLWMFILISCSTSSVISNTTSITSTEQNQSSESSAGQSSVSGNTASQRVNEPIYRGDGGKGITIVIPAPAMRNVTGIDDWMPLFFQDRITGDFAKFSAMTVIDRLNEQMILAEQNLSLSGNYSDNDYIRIGNLTNAQFLVAGNIQNISGQYNVSFRINNTETNEIRASFSKQYGIENIESGFAAREAIIELLAGMGIEFTETGERQLRSIQPNQVRSQIRLAHGITSEKNNNEIESLMYFYQALNADSGMREASQHIQNFSQDFSGTSIRERAEWATTQKARWEKIFDDLASYVNENLLIVIYDFSKISDRFNASTNTVNLTITPGIKLIPDRTVLNVWKTVIDEWERTRRLEENRSWANSVSIRRTNVNRDIKTMLGMDDGYTYQPTIELYDSDGIRIANLNASLPLTIRYRNDLQILPQNRYFNNTPFREVKSLAIKTSDITDNLSAKVVNIKSPNDMGGRIIPARILSINEWEEWLRKQ